MTDEKIYDGGPAFAGASGFDGMSLRDYFAAKALAGFMANPTPARGLPRNCKPEDLAAIAATSSYLMADAMLKARSA